MVTDALTFDSNAQNCYSGAYITLVQKKGSYSHAPSAPPVPPSAGLSAIVIGRRPGASAVSLVLLRAELAARNAWPAISAHAGAPASATESGYIFGITF
eukprot:1140123-Pelagomonas_calceolata.AAC.3